MIRYLILFVLFVGHLNYSFAQDFPKQPVPPRIVNDFAGILTASERNMLENRLVAFNDTTTTQIAVITVKSLNGYDPNDYAARMIDLWGIGRKGKDNGILILIQPKTAEGRGQVAISTGYGLEGVVPDAVAKMIIEKEIIPSFQVDDYYGGIVKATNVLFQLTHEEFTAEEYEKQQDGGNSFLFFIIIGIILLVILSGRKGGKRGIRGGSTFPWWMIGGGMMGGGGGRSGGGGGGFGGFGGGRGGGGGASGSW